MDWSKPGGFSSSSSQGGLTFKQPTTSNKTSSWSSHTNNSMDVDVSSIYPSLTGEKKNGTTTTATKTTNVFKFKESDPSTSVEHQEFARVLEQLYRQPEASEASITSTLEQFEILSADSAKKTQGMALCKQYNEWQSESFTWLLLAMLFRTEPQTMDSDLNADSLSDKDLIIRLKDTDSTFRHHLTVKAWLQEIAPKFTPIVTAKNYSGTSLLNSRSPFSFQTSSHLTGGAQSSENQDPDAATRDGAKLNDHNERAERDLLKTVWEYIRRGNMEEAKEACIKAGEHWRAESIGGGEFYTELPAFGVLDAESTDIPRGNKSRSLWKGTCYNLANDATADQYERAIYGALSGDVASVLPVCFTWEDHAWAQYNALVESMTEAQLSKYGRGDSCAELPLPQAHIDEAKDIFASIANSNKPELRSVVDDIFFKIQRGIILGQTNQLVTQLAKDARVSFNMGKALSPQMQRFLAHFVLLLRSKGLDIPKEDGDFFVNNYVEYLIAEKMYKIAPLYASYLPKDLQVKTCSKFLKGFTGPRVEREKQVAALRKYGVDLHGILIATVDQLLEQSKAEIEKKTDFASTLKQNITAQTSKQERQIVTILEWLSFSPSEYTECVKRGNSIIRKYLANGRLGAAFTLSNSLPFEAEKSDPFYETPQQMAMSKEYLHYQDLFSARLCFHEWQDAIQSKPSADAPRSEVQKWESLVKTKANQATEEIEKLLKSKWLSECKLPEDDARNNELEHLRKLYISELVMNLHQVYFDSRDLVPGFLAKSVAMVNLVASESVMLYEQMQESQRLQEFLAQIRLSSLELIKAGQSPFGF